MGAEFLKKTNRSYRKHIDKKCAELARADLFTQTPKEQPRCALSEYGSHHDDNEGRGLGFRPLFIGLANISEFIRIRTDDHSREFEWTADGDIDVRTVQKSHLDGFICSVLCSSPQ